MSEFWRAAASWAGQSAITGAALLLLGWVVVRLLRTPARRHLVAGWVFRAAAIVPVLCLIPAWVKVPVPAWFAVGSPSPAPSNVEVAPAIAELRLPDEAVAGPEPTALAMMPERNPRSNDLPSPPWGPIGQPEPVLQDVPPDVAWNIPRGEVAISPNPTAATTTAAVCEPQPGSSPRSVPNKSMVPPTVAAAIATGLVLAYWSIAAALFGQLLLGHVTLVRWSAAGGPASIRVAGIFDAMAVGFRRTPRLIVSDRVSSPACFGLWRTTVLLPRSFAVAATAAELRWVFAHELDHLRRGDHRTAWYLGAVRALYFFAPWLWPLRKGLLLNQEILADAAAASAGGSSVDYAAFLVTLSGGPKERRPTRPPFPASGARANRSDLFRRVTMLVERTEPLSPRPHRRWAVLAAVGSLSAAVFLSGLGLAAADEKKPVPPTEPTQKEPAKGDKPKEPAPREGDKPKPDAPREGDKPRDPNKPRDGDKPRGEVTIEEVDALKRKIIAAAAGGNVEELRRLSEELARMMAKTGVDPFVNPRELPDVGKLKQAMAERIKAFELDIDKLKGSPEAQEAIRRAMNEYRKAIEQALQGQAIRGDAERATGRAEELFRREVLGKVAGGREAPASRLGVSLSTVPESLLDQLDLPKNQCLLVTAVAPGSVAEKVGLKKNDVLLTFAGREITADATRFADQIAKQKGGEKFDIVVLRKGKKEAIKGVELAEVKQDRRVEIELSRGPRIDFEQMQVQASPEGFKIEATKGDVKYLIEGKRDGGKSVVSSIVIASGKGKEGYKSLSDLPDGEHRAAVQQLLGSVR